MAVDDWREVKLSEVANVVGGGTPSRSEPALWEGEIPWATPTDVTKLKGRYIDQTGSTISEEGLRASAATLLPPGSVLMTSRATIGACAINLRPMATNQGFQNLVPSTAVLAEFLAYSLQHRRDDLVRLAAGSTFLEISRRSVAGFPVLLPPLPEQQKIAAILSSVDDVIEKTEAVIAQLQVAKKAMMQELLTRGLPGRHTRFKVTEIGEVPEEWGVATIGELLSDDVLGDVQDGNHGEQHPKAAEFTETGVPFVMARDLQDGSVNFGTCAFLAPERARRLRVGHALPGDVLLTHKGTIGRVAMLGDAYAEVMLTPQVTLYRVANDTRLARRFLYFALMSETAQRQLFLIAKQSTRDYVGITAQRQLVLPLPSVDEQRRLVAALDALEERVCAEQACLVVARQTKMGLASALLTGELRVNIDQEVAA